MDEFEWDERKRESNLAKHGVDFEDIQPLFDGRIVEATDGRRDYGEMRIICVGAIADRVFVVIYTWRGGKRRIISARDANAKERESYRGDSK